MVWDLISVPNHFTTQIQVFQGFIRISKERVVNHLYVIWKLAIYYLECVEILKVVIISFNGHYGWLPIPPLTYKTNSISV
jgi:hypothetical protein